MMDRFPDLKAPVCCTISLHPQNPLSPDAQALVVEKLRHGVKEIVLIEEMPVREERLLWFGKIINDTALRFHLETFAKWDNPRLLLDGFMRFPYLSTFRVLLSEPDVDSSTFKLIIHCGIETWSHTFLTEKTSDMVREIATRAQSLGAKGSVIARDPRIEIKDNSLLAALNAVMELQEEGYNVIFQGCLPHCFFPHSWQTCDGGMTSAAMDRSGNLMACRYGCGKSESLLRHSLEKSWKHVKRAKRTRSHAECVSCAADAVCSKECEAANRSLILKPILNRKTQQPSFDITLKPELCPVPLFDRRDEPFGGILIKGRTVLPMSREGLSLVNQMDGNKTLEEFRQQFGNEGIEFLYHLYALRLIRFRKEKHR